MKWNELKTSDLPVIRNLLLDWQYRKRYGDGESPASEKQVMLIEDLGEVAELGLTKIEASRIINNLMHKDGL